jgi:DNA-binding response OmpR family regulator
MDVLIIEREEPLIRLMAWALQSEGLSVGVAPAIDEALQTAAADKPRCVIFNTGMPDSEKRQCIDDLRRRAPGAMIIDLATPDRQPHGPTGADAYLATPFYPDKVSDLVRQLLGARSPGLP